jgi:ABC-type transport system involved in cytochrome c biogenesis permease component
MNEQQNAITHRTQTPVASNVGVPVWWLVCKQELADLWLRGRALIFLIIFCVLLSFSSLMREWESQLSSIPPRELVFITLQSVISFGLFIGLIIGADSISGERERATLESLLLTPTSRQQIVIGKFLAALSPWPAVMLLSLPYMYVMSHGHPMVWRDSSVGAVMGTLLAVAFTAFGMLVSMWSKSNKNSLFISLLIYILFLIPTMWPGVAQKGDLGYFIQQLNPIQGTSEFLAKVIINNRSIQEKMPYAMAALLSAIFVPALLILYAAPRLAIEGTIPRPTLTQRRTRLAGLLLTVLLMVFLSMAVPLHAATLPITPLAEEQPMQISVDLDHVVASTGDRIEFKTVVKNAGSQASAPFNISMNIIKIGSGDPVDPEDWSPERSQEIDSLAPGASAEQAWTVDTILAGNYMIYLTVIPIPSGPEATTQTTSSQGIHVTVNQVTRTNPGGVLPLAIGIPVLLTLGTFLVRRRWQRGAMAGAQTS